MLQGPIVIGKNTIVEEQVVIVNSLGNDGEKVMRIGSNCLIEVGARIKFSWVFKLKQIRDHLKQAWFLCDSRV